MKGIFGGSEVEGDGEVKMGFVGVVGVIIRSPGESDGDGDGDRASEMERSMSCLVIVIAVVLTLLDRICSGVVGDWCLRSVSFILAIV